jgi:hypothetical protein
MAQLHHCMVQLLMALDQEVGVVPALTAALIRIDRTDSNSFNQESQAPGYLF